LTFRFTEADAANLPEVWLRFLNGPEAGAIDSELARQEMPWLVGAPEHLTFRPGRPVPFLPFPGCRNSPGLVTRKVVYSSAAPGGARPFPGMFEPRGGADA
jgi:hypothetical protein